MQSCWWPQWSCSWFPWHLTPLLCQGQGLKSEHMALTPPGIPRFLFFNVASFSESCDSQGLKHSTSKYYCILYSTSESRAMSPSRLLLLRCTGKSFKLPEHSRLQRQHLFLCFQNSMQTLQALTDTFSWVGFKPGLLPKWIKSLQLFLINHHTCYLNVDYTYTNIIVNLISQ